MRIKVCGMTDIRQMHELGDIGVEFAGMIFYHKSPRFALKHGLTGEAVRKAKLKVYKVGVFVNSSYDEVMNIVDNFGLDIVQLHGNETPYQCSKISNYIQVIKAFRFAEYDNVEWMIKDYYVDTDMFLFDTGITVKHDTNSTKNEVEYGGTGRKFNWKRLSGLDIGKPFFLSGGIEPSDAKLVKGFMQDNVAKDLFAVDINSRFEKSPGIKNMQQVQKFVSEVKELNNPHVK
jgi:phosphoribosylanthranilate isomerase